jgi:hypothetical protein
MLDRDIWLTANLMLKRHGADAEIQAAMKADEMTSRGDLAGWNVWRRVLTAVRELTNTAATSAVN